MMEVDAYRVQGDRDAMIAAYERARDYDPSKKDEIDSALKLIEGHSVGAQGIKVAKDPFAAQANGANQQLVGATKAPIAPAAGGATAAGMSPELARLFKDAEAKLALDPKATEDLASKILGADGGSANAYFLRGLARKQQREFVRAIEDFSKAITLGLRSAFVYAARAASYEATRELTKAEADALEAARLDPRNGRRYLQLGQIQAELGQAAEAKASLDQAQTLDPSLADAALALERQLSVPAGASKSGKPTGWLLLGCSAALFLIAGGAAFWKSRRDAATSGGTTDAGRASGKPTVIDDTPTADRGLGAGDRIGEFELKARAGRGGMGEVWEAWDHVLNRRVALKRILVDRQLDEDARERFIAEARAAAMLTHRNKPEVYGLYEGRPSRALWLAQEFVAGGSVADALQDGPLPPDRCLAIAKGIGDVLDCFHAKKIIHRDLKPSNILLDGDVPKIADFGIAREASSVDGTVTAQPAGTPLFMAPEQHDGIVSPQTDLYALGVALYQCLTGTLPFSAGDLDAKRQGRFARPSSRRAGLPASVDAFFERALAPEPGNRFPSGKALAAELERALRESRGTKRSGSQQQPTTPV